MVLTEEVKAFRTRGADSPQNWSKRSSKRKTSFRCLPRGLFRMSGLPSGVSRDHLHHSRLADIFADVSYPPFFRHIAELCEEDARLSESVKAAWFSALDGFVALVRSSDKPKYRVALKEWREFGDRLEVDETEARLQETRSRVNITNGLLGCDWLRCPLQKELNSVPQREMMRCSGCLMVRAAAFVCDEPTDHEYPAVAPILRTSLPATVSTTRPKCATRSLIFIDRPVAATGWKEDTK